jgi:hypothetical protein
MERSEKKVRGTGGTREVYGMLTLRNWFPFIFLVFTSSENKLLLPIPKQTFENEKQIADNEFLLLKLKKNILLKPNRS